MDDTLPVVPTASQGAVARVGLALGQVVGGRYELSALLGAGGMGAVFRALDTELDEEVALKVLRAELSGSGLAEQQFKSEVKLARRITHKNVARIFELGTAGAIRYLTMELIEGVTLSAQLHREGRFAPARAAEIVRRIADGLGAVHEAGVIHRDVKPSNVLLADDGRVVLTDFGLALIEAGNAPTKNLIGTPDYMSPEQVRGLELTVQSDLYALGVLAFELVTGTRPFRGATPVELALARLHSAVPRALDRVAELPPALSDAIARAMAIDPAHRPATARELGESILRGAGLAPELRASITPAPAPVPHERALPSIAVLPFAASAESADHALGFAEDLVDTLSSLRGLRVVALRASERLAGRSAHEIGQALGVERLVEGSLRGERLSVRLLQVADGTVEWAHRADLTASTLLQVADAVAMEIAQAMGLPAVRRTGAQVVEPAALELYLEARKSLSRYDPRARELFEAAVAQAPRHPQFLAGLASARVRAVVQASRPLPGEIDKAEAAALDAIALAPQLAEPHLALAQVRLHQGHPGPAIHSLRRAVALGPSMPEGHATLGELLLEIGRIPEGAARLRKARTLDPNSALAAGGVARVHAYFGEWEQVRSTIVAAAGGFPTEGPMLAMHARYGVWAGDRALARQLLAALPAQSTAINHAVARAYLTAYFEQRLTAEAVAFRHEATTSWRRASLGMQLTAEIALVARDRETAIDAIERADGAGLLDRTWMEMCPLLEPLRGSERFARVAVSVAKRADAMLEEIWS